MRLLWFWYHRNPLPGNFEQFKDGNEISYSEKGFMYSTNPKQLSNPAAVYKKKYLLCHAMVGQVLKMSHYSMLSSTESKG